MSEEQKDPSLEELAKLIVIQRREEQIAEIFSIAKLPYNVITASALICMGIHMLVQVEMPNSEIETFLLHLASSFAQAKNGELN
jgi:hypothetical protein